MTTPLSIVYNLLWLEEMGLAGAAAGGCVGVDADPCASNATGTADKAASRKESLLVTGMLLRLNRAGQAEAASVTSPSSTYVVAAPKVPRNNNQSL
jgi:hypothetical protein